MMLEEENKEIVEEVVEAPIEEVTPIEVETMKAQNAKGKKGKSKTRKIIEWVITGIFLLLFAVIMVGQIDGMIHKKDHYNKMINYGLGAFIVQTDSMEPLYKVNTALITYLEDVDKLYERFQNKKADEYIDITFVHVTLPDQESFKPLLPENQDLNDRTNSRSTEVDGYPMTHRIREIHLNENIAKGKGKYTFITAGINTKSVFMGWHEGDPEITINQYQAFTEKELLGVVRVNSPVLGGVFSFASSVWGLLILLLVPASYLVITSVLDIFKAYKEPEGAKKNNNTSSKNGEIELSEEDKKRLKEELLEEMLNKKKGDK